MNEKQKTKEKYARVELPKGSNTDEFVQIKCPSCGSSTSSDHMNINDKVAKCGSCNAVFSFANQLSFIAEDMPSKVRKDAVVYGEV